MTKTRQLLIGLMAAASLTAVAADTFAQPPEGGRRGPPGAEGRGPISPEQRVTKLRAQLNLTPAQESAFQAYLASTGAPSAGQMLQNRRQQQGMTAPQRLDAQIAEGAQRQAELKTRADAARRFYFSLNAEQKTAFDALPPPAMLGMAGGRGGREGRGRRPQQGQAGGYAPQ